MLAANEIQARNATVGMGAELIEPGDNAFNLLTALLSAKAKSAILAEQNDSPGFA
jgi:hypothetical protein